MANHPYGSVSSPLSRRTFVKGLAVGPGGATVYAARVTHSQYAWFTEIRAFDVATGEPKGTFPVGKAHFSWLTTSADGRRLAGRGSFSACAWDLTAPNDPGSAVVEVWAKEEEEKGSTRASG